MIEEEKPDVFVIAGDICNFGEESYHEYLSFFQKVSCTKLAVAGNHDLWTDNESSLDKYLRLGKVLRKHGFTYLDEKPVVLNGIGFVGNIGWYDYSFKLENPCFDDFISVGDKVKRLKEFGDEDYAVKKFRIISNGKVCETGWYDGDFVNWKYSDKEFLKVCLQKLENGLNKVHADVDKVVAVTHHVPFENMVIRRKKSLTWSMLNSYMGSKKIGELLLSYSKVKVVITGHTHYPRVFRNGHIRCYDVSADFGRIACGVITI